MPNKNHWETVYSTKTSEQVSWTQTIPTPSLELIAKSKLKHSDAILDVGGGDSLLVDHLLDLGYENISVLDIASVALERAQKRLGNKADRVTWIESDILSFKPLQKYSLWHDRAAFHFLSIPSEIEQYKKIITQSKAQQMIISTFSQNGPKRCSALPVQQYSTQKLNHVFAPNFVSIESFTSNHQTPFGTDQEFTFSHFKRK